jgi:hypothetical protein
MWLPCWEDDQMKKWNVGAQNLVPYAQYFVLCFVLLILFSVLNMACQNAAQEPGVVALVNGSPVYLHQLEAKYDFLHLDWGESLPPGVEQLQQEYGGILTNLILYKLIEQELAARGLEVTDEEVAAREEEVRHDYPPDEFEKILIEEYIDLNYWREQLKLRISWEKFIHEVLRPRVRIDFQEVQDYYQKNLSEFYLPQRIRFLVFSSPDQEEIKKAIASYKKTKSYAANAKLEELREKNSDLIVHEYFMRVDQLPFIWAGEIKKLKPGEFSRIKNDKKNFYSLVVLKKEEPSLLEPYQAYSIIEDKLTQQKIRKLFFKWVADTLQKAEIKINPKLKKSLKG